MGRISVLSQTLINQIAAGEVIVRPASVVKELVENALDAGARRITVLVENSARDITVVDDGCGMDREDAELALQRHATSKIRTTEDLTRISTRGFRGEAVPSIASVARVEILTRPAASLSGTRVRIEGGRIEEIAAAGCPPGTRFEVRELFFNTPARLKFLKSPRSELNALLQVVTLQAFSFPEVGWRVEIEGQMALEAPPEQSLPDRARSLWGAALGADPLIARGERGPLRLEAILGRPEAARRDRRYQAFFVNRRPIVSRSLSAALGEAYRGLLMTQRQPVAAVFLEIDHALVDVNVHPTKEEVRFRDDRAVAGAMYRILAERLREARLIPAMQLGSGAAQAAAAPPLSAPSQESAAARAATAAAPDFFFSPAALARPGALRKPPETRDAFGAPPPPESTAPESAGSPARASDFRASGEPSAALWERFGDPEPLGQIADTYILASFGEGLLLVDQHAAHEKILYLQILGREQATFTQPLLLPLVIDLPPARLALLREDLPLLRSMGIEIEEFGGASFAVHAIPGGLEGLDLAALLDDLLNDEDSPRGHRASLREKRERVAARMACHAAIKAGRRLSMEEMRRLFADLRAYRDSETCPHGRPTMMYLSRHELDRRFGRIE